MAKDSPGLVPVTDSSQASKGREGKGREGSVLGLQREFSDQGQIMQRLLWGLLRAAAAKKRCQEPPTRASFAVSEDEPPSTALSN